MRERESTSCSSCFATSQFPGVTIGTDGRCNLCNSTPFRGLGKGRSVSPLDNLHRIAAELKAARRGKYDCIIGASGGFDSSYVIYYAKRELGLNPLVVKYDHGFNHECGNANLRAVCEATGVDYRVISHPQRRDVRYVEHFVKAVHAADIYWGICSACHYVVPAAVYRTALDEGIPAILTSGNPYEDELRVPMSFKLKVMLNSVLKVPPWRLPGIAFHLAAARYYLLRLKLDYYVPPFSNLFRRMPLAPIRDISISRFMVCDVDRVARTLESLGWKSPVGNELPMRFDCRIDDSFMNYTFKKATGLSTHAIIANNLIYDEIRSKENLQATVEQYQNQTAPRTREETARILSRAPDVPPPPGQ